GDHRRRHQGLETVPDRSASAHEGHPYPQRDLALERCHDPDGDLHDHGPLKGRRRGVHDASAGGTSRSFPGASGLRTRARSLSVSRSFIFPRCRRRRILPCSDEPYIEMSYKYRWFGAHRSFHTASPYPHSYVVKPSRQLWSRTDSSSRVPGEYFASSGSSS